MGMKSRLSVAQAERRALKAFLKIADYLADEWPPGLRRNVEIEAIRAADALRRARKKEGKK